MKKMRKTLLAVASLLCSATLCTGIGAVVANSPAAVSAETTATYTKTVNGVEYTFEQDFNNLTYTGLGTVVGSNGAKTEVGTTIMAHGNNAGDGYTANHTFYSKDNTTFTSASNGVAFKFDITGYSQQMGRVEFAYGDIVLYGSFFSGNRMKFTADKYDSADAKSSLALSKGSTEGSTKIYNLYEGCFTSTTVNGDTCSLMADGWMEWRVHKNKCTAIGGDTAAAKGYWLKIDVVTQSGKVIALHDEYMDNVMSTTVHDAVSLGYASSGNATAAKSFMKVKDPTASLTINNETKTDIAEWGKDDEGYMKGFDRESTTYRVTTNALSAPSATQLSKSIEFRMKETATKAELESLATAAGGTKYYMNVWMGANLLDIYPDSTFSTFNIRTAWFKTNQESDVNTGACEYLYDQEINVPFEEGAEYAVRVERLAVNPSKNAKEDGSVIRVYMAKCEADGSLASDWDETPVYEHFFKNYRVVSHNSLNNWGVQPGHLNNNAAGAHTVRISSNKWVFAKTNIDGVQKTHKIAKGSNFKLDDLYTKSENTLFLGWSKGAAQYSASDFVAPNTVVYNNMQTCDENVYTPLAIEFAADEKASIRFRQRTVEGTLLPLEVSLKWNVTAQDSNNVGYYFGGIKFGYKLTASNGESVEDEVKNITTGWSEDYSYGVIQSNIGEDYYGLKFTMQAYVELNGVKYYTEVRDMNEHGRSVDFVADAATADVKASAEGEYVHEVEDGKFSYLTKEEYAVVKAAGAVINE